MKAFLICNDGNVDEVTVLSYEIRFNNRQSKAMIRFPDGVNVYTGPDIHKYLIFDELKFKVCGTTGKQLVRPAGFDIEFALENQNYQPLFVYEFNGSMKHFSGDNWPDMDEYEQSTVRQVS